MANDDWMTVDEPEADWDEGWNFDRNATLEGTYLGSKQVEVDDGKNTRIMHRFETPDAKVFAVWGSFKLDRMLPAHSGHYLRLIFRGRQQERGMEVKQYTVQCRDDAAPAKG